MSIAMFGGLHIDLAALKTAENLRESSGWAIQYNAMQCNAMQCNAMQCNAIQYNTLALYCPVNGTFVYSVRIKKFIKQENWFSQVLHHLGKQTCF